MKNWIRSFLIILIAILAYLSFYPVPIDPQRWAPPPAPKLEGDFVTNDYLSQTQYLFRGQCPQCEDIAVDSLGRIYGGASNGKIFRFSNSDREPEVFAETGGRPLGMHFDSLGNLLVADARKGLLSVDPSGKISVLSVEQGGIPYRFADDLETDQQGVVYFSDASFKFSFDKYKLDLLEHRPNGRLLAYHPGRKATTLLLDSLYFANGVAVSHDQTFVLVNETGKFRVRRYWLEGEKKGQTDILIDNLPGFPDGISRGSNGIFWVALVSPRNPSLDKIMDKPFLRKLLVRLPKFMRPAPKNYSFVIGIDGQGRVVYNLQDPEGRYAQISSVQEFNGKLYLGSLGENGVGIVERPE